MEEFLKCVRTDPTMVTLAEVTVYWVRY